MSAKIYTVSGFVSTGRFSEQFSSKRQVNAFLKARRKELSDHYYKALQIAEIDAETGELLHAGHPKMKKAQPKVVTADVYKSHGGAGMTYLWQGQRGTFHFDAKKTGAQNRAAFEAMIVKAVGTDGLINIKPTVQSFAAYNRGKAAADRVH